MADNIQLITPSGGDSGATVKTDDDGTAHWQYVKLAFGADNTQTIVDSISGNPLPVALSATDNAVLDAIQAAVEGTVTVDWGGTVPPIGAGVEATALRVTVATDSTGVLSVDDGGGTLSIDDGGGAITVDGTVTANAGTGTMAVSNAGLTELAAAINASSQMDVNLAAQAADITIADGGNSITIDGTVTANLSATDNAVLDAIAAGYAAEGAALGSGVLVQGDDGTDRTNVLVDTDGHLQVDVLSGGGGGTQYTEDDAAAANPVGTAPLLVRQDTPGTLVSTDGDMVAQRATNYGAAYVQILDSSGNFINTFGGAGGTSATDDTAFTAGSGTGTPAMGFFSTDTVDSGDTGVLAMDASRRLFVSVEVFNASLPAGTNAIGKLAANSGVDIGDVDVTSISAGSNLIGDVGISGARTSGGTTLYKNIDVDESEDQIKGSAGQLYWIHCINLASSVRYLKVYNATAASVTVGTTTPDLTFPIPTQGDTNGAGFTISIPNGIAFGTAITIAATTGVADNDSGAPGANEVVVNAGYA